MIYVTTKNLKKFTGLNAGQINRLAKKAGIDFKCKSAKFTGIDVMPGKVRIQYDCDGTELFVDLENKQLVRQDQNDVINFFSPEQVAKMFEMPGPDFIKMAQEHGINWYELDPENPIDGKYLKYNSKKFIDPDDTEKYSCDLNGVYFSDDPDKDSILCCSMRYKQIFDKVSDKGSLSFYIHGPDLEVVKVYAAVSVR